MGVNELYDSLPGNCSFQGESENSITMSGGSHRRWLDLKENDGHNFLERRRFECTST
jgi:hypothetical protein